MCYILLLITTWIPFYNLIFQRRRQDTRILFVYRITSHTQITWFIVIVASCIFPRVASTLISFVLSHVMRIRFFFYVFSPLHYTFSAGGVGNSGVYLPTECYEMSSAVAVPTMIPTLDNDMSMTSALSSFQAVWKDYVFCTRASNVRLNLNVHLVQCNLCIIVFLVSYLIYIFLPSSSHSRYDKVKI